jgi:dTDP-4-amino-4,6-dideoxygalactose transaminase
MRSELLVFGRPNFGEDEIQAVTEVLRSGWVGMGPQCQTFETELAAFAGAPETVSVSSCTAALHLALLALGVGPGDEVIVPSLTWCATANAALYVGARPVLCDVDPDTLNVTVDSVRAKLTERTRAVIPVHFGGLAVDVEALRRALPGPVAIVEDAAHALGSTYPDGGPVGGSGNLVCFSFYANKNLSSGEGGAICVSDPALSAHLRTLRQSGLPADAWKRYINAKSLAPAGLSELGYKANYTDLQAAIARVQLRRQAAFAKTRLELAQRYRDQLSDTGVHFQAGVFDPSHARHLLVIRLPDGLARSRDDILIEMRGRNVGVSIHYKPLHQSPLYGASPADAPQTEAIAGRILTLPISASMTEADVDYVCEQFKAVIAG